MNIKYPDISKFNFSEMFNDSTGKSDVHLFCGWLVITVGAICFPYTVLNKLEVYANLTLAFMTIGGALLGISRLSKDKPLNLSEGVEEPKKEETI